MLALPTRAICGLSRQFCLMMIYSKEQGRGAALPLKRDFSSQDFPPDSSQCVCPLLTGVRSMHSTDIQWSAILSWGYADNILRLKSKQSEPPINFIQCSQLHQVRFPQNLSCRWG